MSTLMRNLQTASSAVDALASTPGTTAGDRAQQLSQLRYRIDDKILKLGIEAGEALKRQHNGRIRVSQREGD